MTRDRWAGSLERREDAKSAGLPGGGSSERLMSSSPGESTFPIRPHRPHCQEGPATCLHKQGFSHPAFVRQGVTPVTVTQLGAHLVPHFMKLKAASPNTIFLQLSLCYAKKGYPMIQKSLLPTPPNPEYAPYASKLAAHAC